MAAAVGTHGNARMRGADLHVQASIGHGIANLIVHTAGAEDGKRPGERDVAGQREARRHIDHVLFGDAAVEEALRIFRRRFGELLGGGGTAQIGIDGYNGHAVGGQLGQGYAVSCTRGLLLRRFFGACELNHR